MVCSVECLLLAGFVGVVTACHLRFVACPPLYFSPSLPRSFPHPLPTTSLSLSVYLFVPLSPFSISTHVPSFPFCLPFLSSSLICLFLSPSIPFFLSDLPLSLTLHLFPALPIVDPAGYGMYGGMGGYGYGIGYRPPYNMYSGYGGYGQYGQEESDVVRQAEVRCDGRRKT